MNAGGNECPSGRAGYRHDDSERGRGRGERRLSNGTDRPDRQSRE
jgi:hypothetical protein